MTDAAQATGDDFAPTFAPDELDDLARLPTQRMQPLVSEGHTNPALALDLEVEATWRTFCGIVENWAHLTTEYLRERTGSAIGGKPTRLEHVALLVARRRLDAERLRDAVEMLTAAEHPLREQFGAELRSGELQAAAASWQRIAVCMADAVALRCDQVNHVLGAIHAWGGDHELEAAMRFAADKGFWSEAVPSQAGMDAATRLRTTARFLTDGPGVALRITEERDRFVLEQRSCPCGRQVHEASAYGWPLPRVPGPSPITYGRHEMTPYQVHFAVIHGQWAIDRTGSPAPAFDCLGTDVVSARCRSYVYKDGHDVPARFFEALGRSRPDREPTPR